MVVKTSNATIVVSPDAFYALSLDKSIQAMARALGKDDNSLMQSRKAIEAKAILYLLHEAIEQLENEGM